MESVSLVPIRELSLYIHIPYCKRKCSYCDFYSGKLADLYETEQVLQTILLDTEELLQSMGNPKITTLFIGGGTPSVIPHILLQKFLSSLNAIINGTSVESTMEINPETVSPELFALLKDYKINRLSIGIQSMDNKILKTLGRNTTAETSMKALRTLKEYWDGSFNIDLMNTVPGQDVKTALEDIEFICKTNPDHISLYNLTIEKSTKLYRLMSSGKMKPVSESVDYAIQNESAALLESLGYIQYEISNYAKGGKISLHNYNYWNMGAYLGVGPSGASTLLSRNGPVRIELLRSIEIFINSGSFSERSSTELIKPASFLLEHLMMGFRLKKGIDYKKINKIFNMNINNYLYPVFEKWGDFILFTSTGVSLNKKGLNLLNPFLVDIASFIDANPLNIKGKGIIWPVESS